MTFPYVRRKATSNAAALTALGGKPWAALQLLPQPNGWRSAAQLERIHHPAKGRMLPVLHLDPAIEPAIAVRALAVLRHQSLQPHQAHYGDSALNLLFALHRPSCCMARLARVVIPGYPHHVTQRGNGRARTFFSDDDYALYRDMLAASCRAAEVEIWAWCLMPNHTHLILVPSDADGLRRALAPVHRRYAGIIHARRKRTGHFWQGRFGCVAMDEAHLAAALRYVSLNPVRARLVDRARAWRWSSARAHLAGRDDGITVLAPVRERYPDFANFLSQEARCERSDSSLPPRRDDFGRPLAIAIPSPRRAEDTACSQAGQAWPAGVSKRIK